MILHFKFIIPDDRLSFRSEAKLDQALPLNRFINICIRILINCKRLQADILLIFFVL